MKKNIVLVIMLLVFLFSVSIQVYSNPEVANEEATVNEASGNNPGTSDDNKSDLLDREIRVTSYQVNIYAISADPKSKKVRIYLNSDTEGTFGYCDFYDTDNIPQSSCDNLIRLNYHIKEYPAILSILETIKDVFIYYGKTHQQGVIIIKAKR